ncbi:MAG: hypothetical protein QNL55_08155, partial [Euryarchaeota archaeon]
MLSPVGAVLGFILAKRLLSFKPELDRLVNAGPRADDLVAKPKGFFGKRRYKKKIKIKTEELNTRTNNLYAYYSFTVTLVLLCSIFGGYSVMIPVSMILATALNRELFPSTTPIVGHYNRKYLELWNKYVQSNVHLLLGADGDYDQKLMKKYNRRKSIFIYRWFTKETRALKDLEQSLGTDTSVMQDVTKIFLISTLKFSILLVPIDIIVRLILGEYSDFIPALSLSLNDLLLNGAICCLGIFGAVASTNIMKIAISANPKLKIIPNDSNQTIIHQAPLSRIPAIQHGQGLLPAPSVSRMPPSPPAPPA